MEIIDAAGPGSERLRGYRIRPEQARGYRELLAEDILAVRDVSCDERIAPAREVMLSLGVRSCLEVPLRPRGEDLPILSFVSDQVHEWSEREIRILSAVAELLSNAPVHATGITPPPENWEALLRERKLLAKIFDQAGNLMIMTRNERVVLFTHACERVSGYAASEVLGKDWRELPFIERHEASRLASYFHEVNIPRDMVAEWVARDGTRKRIGWTSTSWIEDDTGDLIRFASGIDLTETERLRAQLEQNKRVASLGRLSATVAHEFNNVLMAIQPFAEVIRRVGAEDQKVHSAAAHILRAVERGRRITQDLLRFMRPGEPARTSVDVEEWLTQVSREASAMLSNGIELTSEVMDDGLSLHGDAVQLTQVLMNLIMNARDALGGEGTITLSARRAGDRVRITVSDDGPGIPPQLRETIFEPLFTTKRNGTGLGLAIAQQIVDAHEGEISVESEPGQGAAFHLLLPSSGRPPEA